MGNFRNKDPTESVCIFYEQKCQIIEEDQRKFGLMLMNWEKLARSCLFRFFLQCLCLQEKKKKKKKTCAFGGTGKIAQWSRVDTALVEDPS